MGLSLQLKPKIASIWVLKNKCSITSSIQKKNQILGFKCALNSYHLKFEAWKEELQNFKSSPKEIK
jgi:hypothetical protein